MSESGSGEPVSSSTDSSKDSSARNCPECGKEYANRAGLIYHLNLDDVDCTGSECPKCDRNLISERGLKLHHKRVHGESIFGVITNCANCGDEYRERKHREEKAERTYCCRDCQHEHYRENGHIVAPPTGEENSNWKQVEYNCDNCDETIYRQRSRFKDRECLYCSRECHWEHLSERYSDGGHPAFEGGYEYYGHDWGDTAKAVREKYNHECQGCGLSQENHGKGLNVHHIVPLRQFDDYKDANKISNLVPLCDACHRKWEGIQLKPELV